NNGECPSLNSQTGCLIIVDTFRGDPAMLLRLLILSSSPYDPATIFLRYRSADCVSSRTTSRTPTFELGKGFQLREMRIGFKNG
ncbi:MAG: hypothetical protein O3C34_19770, partial [Proteobacteria bacterium]|nr:hypothetical protein [Pseudomonadota bacterium]